MRPICSSLRDADEHRSPLRANLASVTTTSLPRFSRHMRAEEKFCQDRLPELRTSSPEGDGTTGMRSRPSQPFAVHCSAQSAQTHVGAISTSKKGRPPPVTLPLRFPRKTKWLRRGGRRIVSYWLRRQLFLENDQTQIRTERDADSGIVVGERNRLAV